MEHIATQLNDYLRGARPGSSNADVARYMIAHLDQLADLRVSDVATATYVSSPTVIRFVRELGYKDYSAFKEQLAAERRYLRIDPRGTHDVSLAVTGDAFPSAVDGWSRHVGHAMCDALTATDDALVEELARDIVGYRHVFCIGFGLAGMFGDYLNTRLPFQNKGLVSMGVPSFDTQLSDDPANTLVILVSQHGNMLRDAPDLFGRLAASSAKTWLVTQVGEGAFNESVVDRVMRFPSDEGMRADAFVLLAAAEVVGQWCWRLYEEDVATRG